MGFTWCKDHEIFWLCIFFFPHGTPRVSSGYLESSWEKEKKKKKRAVISKNLILTFVVGITFWKNRILLPDTKLCSITLPLNTLWTCRNVGIWCFFFVNHKLVYCHDISSFFNQLIFKLITTYWFIKISNEK